VAIIQKKLSAKQRQLEMYRSRKRWMTFLGIAAGFVVRSSRPIGRDAVSTLH
jgi:TRAP-type C4-dicarboxylate transport system permease small subunit